jgi:diguanylate cyclase (GGDEF)-like protein
MRRLETLWLGIVIAAAAALVYIAFVLPARFPGVAVGVALAGYLVVTVVGVTVLRDTVRRVIGVLPLLGGLALLGVSVSLGLLRAPAGPAPALSAGDLALLLQAAGSLGIAVAFLFWARGAQAAAEEVELRERSLREDLDRLEERVRDQAHTIHQSVAIDESSGVLNRRAFLQRFDEVARRAGRVHKPFVFLILDVCNLRAIQIEGGFRESEAALRQVGQALQGATRATDFIGRLGAEHFGIVLGECGDVEQAIERLLGSLAPGTFLGVNGRPIQVRIGAVTVERPGNMTSFQELTALAEEALDSLPDKGTRRWAERSLKPPTSPRVAAH